jgi:V/A-type H+/Na+-transporting ATPase subunit I
MQQSGELVSLAGYIPFDKEDELLTASKLNQWAHFIADPDAEADVPVLIKLPKWVRVINPLMKMLEIFPGYRELDISAVFLLFFTIFVGILIGDAGYGLLYLFLTIFLNVKVGAKTKDKTPFYFGYVLSSSVIVWGLLTGMFFGPELFLRFNIPAILPQLNDTKYMQAFCFLLAAIHLSIAHIWRIIVKLPSLTAFVEAGWIMVIWAAYFFAKTLILSDALPYYGLFMLYFGMILVVFFTNPQKNVLKGAGEGLGSLALSLMNNFTDVVSYIRLFAVGMAGVAIAQTCNVMAAGAYKGTVLSAIASGLILVIGHALNITLGPISILVHGLRLNVLEFSMHAGISWSGTAYKPLKN